MVECSSGIGGCNGWFHPECCGLSLTQEQLDQIEHYTFACSLCVQAQQLGKVPPMKRKAPGPPIKEKEQVQERTGKRGRRPKKRIEGEGDEKKVPPAPKGKPGRKKKEIKPPSDGEIVDDDDADDDDDMEDGELMDQEESLTIPSSKPTAAAPAPARRRGRPPSGGAGRPPKDSEKFQDSQFVIEKILGMKFVQPKVAPPPTRLKDHSIFSIDLAPKAAPPPEREAFYLIKWKGRSYLHASWERPNDLLAVDPNGRAKLKRWQLQEAQRQGMNSWKKLFKQIRTMDEEDVPHEFFNPDYIDIQRLIGCDQPKANHIEELRRVQQRLLRGEMADAPESAVAISTDAEGYIQDSSEDEVKYLVKWRGLPYSDASWETWGDLKKMVPIDVVLEFWAFQKPEEGLLERLKVWEFPKLEAYEKLKDSPVFGLHQEELAEYLKYQEEKKAREAQGEQLTAEDELMTYSLTMRDYQLEGLNWLLWNWWNRRPSILADEMGLGKTIQTTAFLHELFFSEKTKVRGPFLVVSPLSLVVQWQQEINSWSPDMNCIVYHGNSEARQVLQDNEMYFQPPYVTPSEAIALRKAGVVKFNVMITTYELMVRDATALSRIPWKVMVVDEAHRLKNPKSRLFEVMSQIPRDYVVLLTGTPLQNRTEELWALLHFADKNFFASQQQFTDRFGQLQDAAQVAELHLVLKPYLLRRVKEDVEKSLPPKEETLIEVSLTPVQRKFYRAIYEKNTDALFKDTSAKSNHPSLMNVVMELRKCCNHPYLVRGVEERILSEIPEEKQNPLIVHTQMVDSSGKFMLLSKLLPRLREQGHKVLIFSQMVRVLDLLEDFLRARGFLFERLDGNTRANHRTAAVERFGRPAYKRFVMLLSTRAGGLGLNLTPADTVIIFDSDWNPQNDLQAQARAHRIGQTRPVMVYRLLTRGTYEMHMFHMASLKLGLDRAVLMHARNELERSNPERDEADDDYGEETSASGFSPKGAAMLSKSGSRGNLDLQAQEIDQLLKRGAYDVFREEDHEGMSFYEGDIDAILKRAAHKVTYGDAVGLARSLGTNFSKASFVTKGEEHEIDLDDPEFWKKAIGLEGKEVDKLVEQELGKRNRIKQGRFDPYYGETIKFNPDKPEEEASSDDDLDELDGRPRRTRRPSGVIGESTSDAAVTPDRRRVERKKAPPAPPKEWGPHNRDRVLRSLLTYGFGRWERIRREGGAGLRSVEAVETFARAYVLQCGLCARHDGHEGQQGQKESPFVRDAIAAATALDEAVRSGAKEFVMPAILQEERFVTKLKAGEARKALNRLDMLVGLQRRIDEACTKYREARGMNIFGHVDDQADGVPPSSLATLLLQGDVRPVWTRVTAWWDLECDRHLLVGCFLHGFGKYERMKDDPNLCFQAKMTAWAKRHPGKTGLLTDPNVPASAAKKVPAAKRQSKYLGVYAQPGSMRWCAMIDFGDGKSKYLGAHDTEELAAKVYDAKVRERFADQPERVITNFDMDGRRILHIIGLDNNNLPLPWHRASSYRGVRASGNKWTAQISYSGLNHHLGTYMTEIEAAVAYDSSARDNHAEGAILNFPNGIDQAVQELEKALKEEQEVEDLREREKRKEALREQGARLRKGIDNLKESDNLKSGMLDRCSLLGDGDSGDELTENNPEDEELVDDLVEDPSDGLGYKSGQKLDPSEVIDLPLPESRVMNKLTIWLLTSQQAMTLKVDLERQKREYREKRNIELMEKNERRKKMKEEERQAKAMQREVQMVERARMRPDLLPGLGLPGYGMPGGDGMMLDGMMMDGRMGQDGVGYMGQPGMMGNEMGGNISEILRQRGMQGRQMSYGQQGLNYPMQGGLSNDQLGVNPMVPAFPKRSAQLFQNQLENNVFLTLFEWISPHLPNAERVASMDLHYDREAELAQNRATTLALARNHWQPAERAAFFTAVLASGAPDPVASDKNDEVMNLVAQKFFQISQLGLVPDDFEPSEDEPLYNIHHSYSWSDFVKKAGLQQTKSDEQAASFYMECFLPTCLALCHPGAPVPDFHSISNPYPPLTHFPDPARPIEEHSQVAAGSAYLFLCRQQVLRTLRFAVQQKPHSLLKFLKTRQAMSIPGKQNDGVPFWWCPWIHDYGLVLGCLKHGYLCLNIIRRDETLPLHQDAIKRHVDLVFAGSLRDDQGACLGNGESIDAKSEEHHILLQLSISQFPTKEALDLRLKRICIEILKEHAKGHPLKARIWQTEGMNCL